MIGRHTTTSALGFDLQTEDDFDNVAPYDAIDTDGLVDEDSGKADNNECLWFDCALLRYVGLSIRHQWVTHLCCGHAQLNSYLRS